MSDINYMMYTSMNGDTRQENFEGYFDAYYANFASILAANNQAIKFTLRMLKEEFYAKNIYGLIIGSSLAPMVLMESEDSVDIMNVNEEDKGKLMAEINEKIMNVVQKNPLMTSRFLSMFDEMKLKGLFDSFLS